MCMDFGKMSSNHGKRLVLNFLCLCLHTLFTHSTANKEHDFDMPHFDKLNVPMMETLDFRNFTKLVFSEINKITNKLMDLKLQEKTTNFDCHSRQCVYNCTVKKNKIHRGLSKIIRQEVTKRFYRFIRKWNIERKTEEEIKRNKKLFLTTKNWDNTKYGDYQNGSQDHKGNEFIMMFPSLSKWDNTITDAQLIITADTTALVEIASQYGGVNQTRRIINGMAYVKLNPVMLKIAEGRTYSTIYIRSDQLITVVCAVSKSFNSHVYAYNIYPLKHLGETYVVTMYPDNGIVSYQGTFTRQNVGILSSSPNTTVTVESNSDRIIYIQTSVLKPHDSINITLDYLEGFNIEITGNMTGTMISANKPVFVFSGNDDANIKLHIISKSYTVGPMFECMIPVTSWAKRFVVPYIAKASKISLQIVTKSPNTSITISGAHFSKYFYGNEIFVELPAEGFALSSSEPVLLALYTTIESRYNVRPFMTLIPGIDHWSTNYVIAPPALDSITFESYISIMIKASNSMGLRYVGNLLETSRSASLFIDNEIYETFVLQMAGDAVYKLRHISSDVLFGAIVYGYHTGDRTAYAFPAGFRFL